MNNSNNVLNYIEARDELADKVSMKLSQAYDLPADEFKGQAWLAAHEFLQDRPYPKSGVKARKLKEYAERILRSFNFDDNSQPFIPIDAEHITSSYNEAERELLHNQTRRRINRLLLSLRPREERVLRLRFGLGGQIIARPTSAPLPRYESDGLSLEEVGSTLFVTRERIRQTEAKALRRLKHPSRKGAAPLQEFLIDSPSDPQTSKNIWPWTVHPTQACDRPFTNQLDSDLQRNQPPAPRKDADSKIQPISRFRRPSTFGPDPLPQMPVPPTPPESEDMPELSHTFALAGLALAGSCHLVKQRSE